MKKKALKKTVERKIDAAVQHFSDNKHLFEIFAKSLIVHLAENQELAPYIHFLKYRVKDPQDLRNKLIKRAINAASAGSNLEITKDNLFTQINDLAGVKILHLHTEQLEAINRIIIEILTEHKYPIVRGPIGMCWDLEYETLFQEFGITTESRDSMYTSVHYVIEANQKTSIKAELQVRTLMEEVWGEVSHRVNYPSESINKSCREQLKVLARFTSGCTRLVDSIFQSEKEG